MSWKYRRSESTFENIKISLLRKQRAAVTLFVGITFSVGSVMSFATASTTTTTLSLTPSADAKVVANQPNTNFGLTSPLITDIQGSTDQPTQISFLKFDTRALKGRKVTSAKLSIVVTNESAGQQTVKLAGTNYQETGVTYNTRPVIDSTVIGTIPGGRIGQTVSIDLNKDVVTWVSNVGSESVLSIAVQNTGTDGFGFASREVKASAPRLVVSSEPLATAQTTVKPTTTTAKPTTTTSKPVSTPTSSSFVPSADARVVANQPNTNFGSVSPLLTDLQGSTNQPTQISFLKFDLRALRGRQTTSAKLNIVVTNESAGQQTIKIASSNYQENQLTYSNRPTINTMVIGTIPGGKIGQTVSVDINKDAVTYVSNIGTENALSLAVENTGTDGFGFASREVAASAPRLVVSSVPVANTTTTTVKPTTTTAKPVTTTAKPTTTTAKPTTTTAKPVTTTAKPTTTTAKPTTTTAKPTTTTTKAPATTSTTKKTSPTIPATTTTAPKTAPSAPTGLVGTPGTGQIGLSWSAPSSDGGSAITDYIVEYKASAASTWTAFADGTTSARSATITGLAANATYNFRVFAVNSIGVSSASNTATAATLAAPSTSSPGAHLPISYSLSSLGGTKRFVATNGSDSNSGTEASPFATLAKAISASSTGDSVVVRGGTYREGNITANKSIKVIAYPGEIPVFNGARTASGFATDGSLKSISYSAQPVADGSGISFTSGQNLTGDGVGKFADQAWIGSTRLKQVTSTGSVTDGKFAVASGKLYLTANDAAKGNIEVSNKNMFMKITSPNFVLEGIKITRYSNNAADANKGVLMVSSAADNVTVRNIDVSDSSFIAVMWGDSGLTSKGLMVNSTVSNSNWMGVSAMYTDDLTLDSVVIQNMNYADEFTSSPQSGAVKTSRTRHTKVLNSEILNNHSHGLWFDQSNVDVDVANNVITGNTGSSVFFEISDDLLLINNYIQSSGGARPVKLAGSSGLKLINNTIVGGADPIGIYTDSRSIAGCSNPANATCAGSYSSDRDTLRGSIPATLDWIPRLDMMINNIIVYPTASGYCGNVGVCVTTSNSSASVSLSTIFHKADSLRPQTVVNGNVYANGSNKVIAAGSSYLTHTDFANGMASAVGISGFESAGKTGNSWVNSDGSPTSALSSANSSAAAVPSNADINQYMSAGTKRYGTDLDH